MIEAFSASIAVAPDNPLFAGHFPGHPILPGVAHLGLVMEALAPFVGADAALQGVRRLRLRRLVEPGDRLELRAHRVGKSDVRCELARGATTVSNGVLRLADEPFPPSPPSGVASAPPRPGAHELSPPALPQQAPMRLPTERLRYSERGLQCDARVPSGCGFVSAGWAPAYSCIELAAQCAAAWEALGRAAAGGREGPRVGYLVGMRDVELFARSVPADRTVTATITLEEAAPPLSRYDIEVSIDSLVVVRGRIDTVLTDRAAL